MKLFILVILCAEYCLSNPVQNFQFAMYPTPFRLLYPGMQLQPQYSNPASTSTEQTEFKQSPATGMTAETISNEYQNAINKLPQEQRQIIGSIINAIPFLPIEINVPDAIAAFVNGIQGFFGNIGQRFPVLNNWAAAQTQQGNNGMMMMQTRVGYNGEQMQAPMIIFVPINMRQSRSLEVKPADDSDDAESP